MDKTPPKAPRNGAADLTGSDGAAKRDLSLAETNRVKKLGSDPYNSPTAKRVAAKRSLDDMRRLSEDIRTAPTWVPPPRDLASDLALRVAGLRVELERVLTELERLTAAAVDPADVQGTDQRRQIRDAVRYLEDAIDRLVPLEDQREPRR
jgi:hypothetical protein